METLKKLENVAAPDKRNLYFVVKDSENNVTQLSLEHIHSIVDSIQLHEGVPEEIRSHFSQAQNLAIYSWFHYPFHVTAQFMGFVTVEFALKDKTGKKSNFKNLIKEAVDQGWIKDEGFSVSKIRKEPKDTSYVEILIELMPKLRNELAHGSSMIHNDSSSSLLICAEFINQLYEVTARPIS